MNPPEPARGAERLKAIARRVGHALHQRAPGWLRPPDPPALDAPAPSGEWDLQAEERLQALERKLGNQNRLLLFSLVAIIGDIIAKVLTRSGP